MASASRIHRLLALISFLQSGRMYSTVELAELCSVSRRTVFRDIGLLRDSGIQIVNHPGRGGYSMVTPSFLKPADLTLAETLALLTIGHDLGGMDGIPFQSSAKTAAAKLLSGLPSQLRDHVGELTEQIEIRLDPHNSLSKSEETYSLMKDAIRERKKIRIQYDDFSAGKEISTLLSPYRLLFQRRSWYVIGRSSVHRQVRTFHLGRVLRAEITDSEYKVPQRFTLKKYLGNAWSMIRETDQKHTVLIRFQPMVARNVAEVTWHHTQKLIWNDDCTLDFQVQVEGLREIQWWVLGYGSQAEVLQPAELRTMIREHLVQMVEKYEEKSSDLDELVA
ncbi:helix-turn-helix transcriptional regulator [Calycomorphotria hydatis]|uniref:Bifunctional biotin--[acetyl-CoA-carboxylase] synthetase/biotin operon repressor n=1 Tax=Calycomorphotria hydatis TaxID=2528027 RepID=A0A517TBV3_9PLAN|nr:WYL domain-containing protein [Calycomorphotria hydatis]QDT65839.1 bifunctional biotin--[acetyl-CoA-carboxylase] synthetase/biotin operon repressor [Calycomorphotria hydatis]